MEDNKPKQYNIDSFDKLCNVVTPENVERLALDLMQWLLYYSHTLAKIRETHPKETKGKTNSKIAKGSFVWIDDGKNDLLHATMEDKNTGEIVRVDFPPTNEQNPERSIATGDA